MSPLCSEVLDCEHSMHAVACAVQTKATWELELAEIDTVAGCVTDRT